MRRSGLRQGGGGLSRNSENAAETTKDGKNRENYFCVFAGKIDATSGVFAGSVSNRDKEADGVAPFVSARQRMIGGGFSHINPTSQKRPRRSCRRALAVFEWIMRRGLLPDRPG